jgi:hypothetical protein
VHRDREVQNFDLDFADWQYEDDDDEEDDDFEMLEEYEIEDLED